MIRSKIYLVKFQYFYFINNDIIIKNYFYLNKIFLENLWGLGVGDWGMGPIPNPQVFIIKY